MFNHIMIGTNDIAKSKAFYEKVLAVLGGRNAIDNTSASGHQRAIFIHDGNTFMLTQPIDGEAATCEDFIVAMEDGAGRDLTQFRLWYSQAGTPKVSVKTAREGSTAVVELPQDVPATPGQDEKQPMPIPLRIALFDRETGAHRGEKLIGQSEKVKSLREKLPKHRLHYNSINDLAAYRENLRQEYKRLNPADEDSDE